MKSLWVAAWVYIFVTADAIRAWWAGLLADYAAMRAEARRRGISITDLPDGGAIVTYHGRHGERIKYALTRNYGVPRPPTEPIPSSGPIGAAALVAFGVFCIGLIAITFREVMR